MARCNAGNNGNGDGELKAPRTITWGEKSLPKGDPIGMGEAAIGGAVGVIPSIVGWKRRLGDTEG